MARNLSITQLYIPHTDLHSRFPLYLAGWAMLAGFSLSSCRGGTIEREMRFLGGSTSRTQTVTMSPTWQQSEGCLIKRVGDPRDVHKPILMDTDVNKNAEIDDVAHRAGELHPGAQILHREDIGAQNRLRETVADIPAGTLQFGDDVPKGGNAYTARIGGPLHAIPVDLFAQGGKCAAADIPLVIAKEIEKFESGVVRFGVYRRVIECVLPPGMRRNPAHCSNALARVP